MGGSTNNNEDFSYLVTVFSKESYLKTFRNLVVIREATVAGKFKKPDGLIELP